MKSKNELKIFFENGDIPRQEEFWEWQDSYWHKDERLPAEAVDLSTKADLVDGKVPASQLPDTSEKDTLSDVMTRGNIANAELKFHDNAKLWYDLPTFSYYFNNGKSATSTGKYNTGIGLGVLSSLTSGYENVGVGSQSLEKLTTGFYNSGLGLYSLGKLTTGGINSAIGYSSFYNTTTGNSNTGLGSYSGFLNVGGSSNCYLGTYSGQNLTNGNNNTFVGSGSGRNHGKTTTSGAWGHNTFIGYNAAYTSHAMGTWGDNNLVIGANAPLGSGESNRLVIHSQMSSSRHDQTLPLISGNFASRYLSIGGTFNVNPTYVADSSADSTYDHLISFNNTSGNFGKTSLENFKNSIKRPYKVYSALLEFNQTTLESQFGILENTIGDIVWTKIDTGRYQGVLAGGFSNNKTLITTDMNEFTEMSSCTYLDNDTLLLRLANIGGDLIDIGGQCGTIEIRVY